MVSEDHGAIRLPLQDRSPIAIRSSSRGQRGAGRRKRGTAALLVILGMITGCGGDPRPGSYELVLAPSARSAPTAKPSLARN